MALFSLRHAILATLPFALALACGGSSAADAKSVPLADVPKAVATAICGVYEPCLGAAFSITFPGKDCVARSTASINDSDFSLLPAAITKGTVVYDGTQVSACTDAIAKAGCGALTTRLSTLCASVLTGTVKAGGACTINGECGTGSFCKTSQACPGACTPLQAAGQDCTQDDECQNGLSCSGATSKCAKPAGKGEACKGAAGAECAPDFVCQGGGAMTPGTCVTPDAFFSGAAAATCDLEAGKFCQPGLGCALVGVQAGPTGAVAQFKCEKPSAGGACHVAYPEACPSGQYCELTGTTPDGACKTLPGDGQPCAKHVPSSAQSTDELCAVNTICDNGTCRAVQHNGGKCTADDQCYSKLCKNGGCAPADCVSGL